MAISNHTSETPEKLKMMLLSVFLFGIPMGIFFAFVFALQLGDIAIGIVIGAIAGLLAGVCFTLLTSIFKHTVQKISFDTG